MAPIEVHCPECQATLKLKSRAAEGRKVPCPKCGQPFVIEIIEDDEIIDDFDDMDDFGDLDEEPETRPTAPVTKKSSAARWWVIGSILVVALGVGGFFGAQALGLFGGATKVAVAPPPPVENKPVENKPAEPVAKAAEVPAASDELDTHWLPPDAQVVASLQLARLWDAPAVQTLIKNPELGPQLKQALVEMKKETILGIDEISKIVVGIGGVSDLIKMASSEFSESGRISEREFEQTAKEKLIPTMVVHVRQPLTSAHLAAVNQKLEQITIDGKTVHAFPVEKDTPRFMVYQANEKTLVFTVERFVKQLIATGDPYTPRPDLAFADGGQDFVVAVALPEPLTVPLPPELASASAGDPILSALVKLNGKLQGLSFGASGSGKDSTLKFQGVAADGPGAAAAKTVLDEVVNLGKQQLAVLKQNEFLAEMLAPVESGINAAKVVQNGPEFGLSATIAGAGSQADASSLIAMLLPAMQASRDAAQRAQCINNLRQFGIAMFHYEVAHKNFPAPAILAADGKTPLLSWRVAILPYLDQEPLYKQFKLDEPWDSPTNKALIGKMPPIFACAGGELKPGMTAYRLVTTGKSIYVKGKAIARSKRSGGDAGGLGEIPLVIEVGSDQAVAWTNPVAFDGFIGTQGHHQGGTNILFADGSVQFSHQAHDVVAGGDDPGDDGSQDQAKLQGKWKVVSAVHKGKPLANYVGQTFDFQGNRIAQTKPGQPASQSSFKIVPTASPRTFDWNAGSLFLGVYQLRGPTLRLTVALPGKPRPASLTSKDGEALQLTLRRDGPAPSPGNAVANSRKNVPEKSPAPQAGSGFGGMSRGQAQTILEDTLGLKKLNLAFRKGAAKRGVPSLIVTGVGKSSASFELVGAQDKLVEITISAAGSKYEANKALEAMPTVMKPFVPWLNKKFIEALAKAGQMDVKIDGVRVVASRTEKDNKLNWTLTAMDLLHQSGPGDQGIDGIWQVESATTAGKLSPTIKGRILAFDEGKACLRAESLQVIDYRFNYEIESSTKPRTFAVYNGERAMLRGVYKQEGGRLYLCFGRGKAKPPEEFSGKGLLHTLYVLKKVKTGTTEEKPATTSKWSPESAARALLAMLVKGEFEAAADTFDAKVKAALPADKLKATWQQVQGQAGKFKSVAKKARLLDAEENKIVDLLCTFEKAVLIVRLSYSKEKKVAGLFFLPGPKQKAAP